MYTTSFALARELPAQLLGLLRLLLALHTAKPTNDDPTTHEPQCQGDDFCHNFRWVMRDLGSGARVGTTDKETYSCAHTPQRLLAGLYSDLAAPVQMITDKSTDTDTDTDTPMTTVKPWRVHLP